MNKSFNLKDFAKNVKAKMEQEFSKERECLESINADKEILSTKDKEEILDYVLYHGWSAEDALQNFLEKKFRKEAKHSIAKELFPEIYDKVCKQKD